MNKKIFRRDLQSGCDSASAEPDQVRIAVANLSMCRFLVNPDGKSAAMDLPAHPDAQRIIFRSLKVLGLNGTLPEGTEKAAVPGAAQGFWLYFDKPILDVFLQAGVRNPVLDAVRPALH
jgi:hypothetical protein